MLIVLKTEKQQNVPLTVRGNNIEQSIILYISTNFHNRQHLLFLFLYCRIFIFGTKIFYIVFQNKVYYICIVL